MLMFNPAGVNLVVRAQDYISEKVQEYIETRQTAHVQYDSPSKPNFTIYPYDSINSGLKGNYEDFYIYANDDGKERSIISLNEEKLRVFCAFINRLTT